MTHPLAALIAGVTRFNIKTGENTDPSVLLLEAEVLAALEAAPVPDLVEAHDEQLGVWADELMADLVLNGLMDLSDHEYDTKVGARREIIAALKQANQAKVPQPDDAPVPDLVEAGKVLEGVTPGPWHVGQGDKVPFVGGRGFARADLIGPESDRLANARFIAWCREGVPALIALATAQAAQIAGLEAADRAQVEVIEKQADTIIRINARAETAEADADTLRAEVERLREALEAIYEITVEPAETDHKNVRGWIEVSARTALERKHE